VDAEKDKAAEQCFADMSLILWCKVGENIRGGLAREDTIKQFAQILHL
jgi:hypothetical protein